MKQMDIETPKIHLDPNQPREIYDHIEELASSMKEYGFKKNFAISVRPHPSITGEYMVIFGHRRRMAAELAGIGKIPTFVFTEEISDTEIFKMQLVENENRKDLTIMNRVRALHKGINQYSMSYQELANYFGVSESTIKAELELITLAPDLHKLVDNGEIPKEVARKLAVSFPEEGKQMSVFNNHVKNKKNATAMLAAINTYIEKSAQVDVFAQAKEEAAENNGSLREYAKAFERLARMAGDYQKKGYLGNLNVINANKRSLSQVEAAAKLLKKIGEITLKDLESFKARADMNAPKAEAVNE